MIFPIEVWELIFYYADPVILTNLKTVCKCWKTIIEKVLSVNTHWYLKCRADIPNDLWSSLHEKLYPNKPCDNLNNLNNDSQVWMAMYRLWLKCKNLTKCTLSFKRLEPVPKHRLNEFITCATFSQNILAIGTTKGYIYFYDIQDLHSSLIYTADHAEHLCNVHLLRNEKELIAVSTSITHRIKIWDVQSKRLLCTTRANHHYSYTIIKEASSREEPMPNMLSHFDWNHFIDTVINNCEVSLHFLKENPIPLNIWLKGNQLITHINLSKLNIRRYYTFKTEIAVCITEYGFLGLSTKTNSWKLHNIYPIFEAIPTAVLIYTHLLVLGLDTGSIHVYYVDDFNAINFNSNNSKEITVDTLPIISLDINTYDGKEFLLAANAKHVHIIKFD